jgi:hypothetical protein
MVFSNGRKYVLPLTGSNAAMTRVGTCLSDNLGHNPFEGSPPMSSANPFR